MKIQIKRAYDPPEETDGARFLVDRVWPRGVKREALELVDWVKEAAPSTELRQWFGHDPARWDTFRERYFSELAGCEEALAPLREAARQGVITLVYGARDTEHNNAVALRAYLLAHRR